MRLRKLLNITIFNTKLFNTAFEDDYKSKNKVKMCEDLFNISFECLSPIRVSEAFLHLLFKLIFPIELFYTFSFVVKIIRG